MGFPRTKQILKVVHLDDSAADLDRVEHGLTRNAELSCFEVEGFKNLESYRKRLKSEPVPDIALLDIQIQTGTEGLEVAHETRVAFPNIVILFFSSAKDAKTIIESFKAGADDFISKRSDKDELILRILRSYELAVLKRGLPLPPPESLPLGVEVAPRIHPKPAFVGKTLEAVSHRIPLLLKSAVSALYVEGESGTGKEVVADLFASAIPAEVPFVRINCAAIAPSLLESELFGHSKGSFTGANADRKGLLESASGGWLFMDEIGCLSPQGQAAFLRVLENHEIRRVGETQIRSVRFRLISANNEPLSQLVHTGRFRRDLWQRLNEVEICLPPLRERREEIPGLIHHFSKMLEGGPYKVTDPAIEILAEYDWKEGNIRELRNCIKAMTEFQMQRVLTPLGIPQRIWKQINDEVRDNGTGSPEAPNRRETSPASSELSSNYDRLCLELLANLIRSIAEKKGKLSFRNLSERLNISRKRLTALSRDLVENGFFKPEELDRLVGFKD